VKLSIATQIHLNKFKPREYQKRLIDALENKGYKKILCIHPRRAGKDLTAFHCMLRAAITKIGVYYYIFPTYAQAKKALWNNITSDGIKVLDYVPPELLLKKNEQEMSITFRNGSQIQLVGSNDYDRLMGTNPRGCVFSEYAMQDKNAYLYLRPILTANDGWAIFATTVRGHNHLWDLYNIAKDSPEWFCELLTVEDTQHIPLEEIKNEIREGVMSLELVRQEYYNDWNLGIEGSFFCHYIDKLRLKGQIGPVPWEPSYPVFTAWDLGVNDYNVIIYYQVIGAVIHIIDYYENRNLGLEYYAKVLRDNAYDYMAHFAPFDLEVREQGTGITRKRKAEQLGIDFTVLDKSPFLDGIERVRTVLPKCYIDEVKCAKLIRCLENYRREFDTKRNVHLDKPIHDEWSHGADAFRYLAQSIPFCRKGSSPEDLEKRYNEVRYGTDNQLPPFFR